MSSPTIILTSEFSISSNAQGYIAYMEREEAKESNQDKVIQEAEALVHSDIFADAVSLHEGADFDKFINYMSRKHALEKKEKLAPDERLQYDYLSDKIQAMKVASDPIQEKNRPDKLQSGLFTDANSDLSKEEAQTIKNQFKEASKSGCVLYKDVFSFDTKELIALGIYDPIKDELQREPLLNATRTAMRSLFESENLSASGFWVGEIHYNTNHFHIHVATSERTNSRPLMTFVNKKKKEVTQPKGMRKESSLQAMKTSFMNSLLDRTPQLTQISELRNQSVRILREETDLKNSMTSVLQLKNELGTNSKKWSYKRLSADQRATVDQLVSYYMKDNPSFQEYQKLVTQEGVFRNSLYTKDETKNEYAKNQLADMNTRLGNALLKNIRSISADQPSNQILNPTKEDVQQKNIFHFSPMNQEKIKQRDPLATNLKTQAAWQRLGRSVETTTGIWIVQPVKDVQTRQVTGFERVKVYDVRHTAEIPQDHTLGKNFGPQQWSPNADKDSQQIRSYNDFSTPNYSHAIARDLNRQFKSTLNNEWERQQQLHEHERLQATIAYKKHEIENGY